VLDRLRDVAHEWTVASGFQATTFQALLERRVDAIITSDERPIPEGIEAVTLKVGGRTVDEIARPGTLHGGEARRPTRERVDRLNPP